MVYKHHGKLPFYKVRSFCQAVHPAEGTGERRKAMTHKIFNASNLFSVIAVLALLTVPAAYEGEMYITSIVSVVIFAISTHLAIREDGKRK